MISCPYYLTISTLFYASGNEWIEDKTTMLLSRFQQLQLFRVMNNRTQQFSIWDSRIDSMHAWCVGRIGREELVIASTYPLLDLHIGRLSGHPLWPSVLKKQATPSVSRSGSRRVCFLSIPIPHKPPRPLPPHPPQTHLLHHIIHPALLLLPTSLHPSLTLLFSPPISPFQPQLSTSHSYHTLRSSVQRRMVTESSAWSGVGRGVYVGGRGG